MPKLAEVFRLHGHGLALDLVHRQKQRLAAAHQHAHQVVVGAGQLGARIHHQHQRVGLFQSHLGLGVNLRGNQLRVVGHNAARVHQAKLPALPLELAIDAVAGDAGLVAHNRAAAAVSRLKSVDLPTLGRPTIATRGSAAAPGSLGKTDLRYFAKIFSRRGSRSEISTLLYL